MKPRRTIKWLAGLLVLVLLVLYIVLPGVNAIVIVLPDTQPGGEPPAGFSAVSLTTADGLTLAGWYAPPQNGAVILLVHGAGGGRDTVRPYAAMLRDNGYGVLAFNLRGYGDSAGAINRLGWNGTRDVGAAVDFLLGRDEIQAIGGLGISLGGEVLLGAASAYPEIRAIVTDGATCRTVEEYMAVPYNESVIRHFTMAVRTFFVGVLTGEARPLPLVESLASASGTTYLFIAAGGNAEEVDFNAVFAQTAGTRGSLWVVPDVGHTAGYGAAPGTYEERVIGFFNATLLG